MNEIRSAAVLGAGVMGAQIAAHLANAGVPVLLLDVTAEAARQGLDRATALKPDPFVSTAAVGLVTTGGFDDDAGLLGSCDWVVEAVVEQLDIKRSLLARIEPHLSQRAVISSNTSGIPLALIADGRSEAFRRRWMGTHFFNPPRYLHLVELIPTAETSSDAFDVISRFVDRHLGKGIVVARDTPNFIANHLGLFGVARTIDMLVGGGYTIEEIDAITGPAIGRPKSATFRTMDVAGIDVLAAVMQNLAESATDEAARAAFAVPQLLSDMVRRGWLGAKAGQGFYRRAGDEILTLDVARMEYRAKQAPRLAALDLALGTDSVDARLRALFFAPDKTGRFLRDTLGRLLLYAARITPHIAPSIDDVDRAMRWGFGWELGPFETWDALGVRAAADALGAIDLPPLLVEAHEKGAFRPVVGGAQGGAAAARVPPAAPDFEVLRSAREQGRIVRGNSACSLVDIGEGVLAVEFHAKMNAIGGDTIELLEAGIVEAAANFRALVVGNEAVNFSAGANLLLLLLEAQEGNWDEIDVMVRGFQRTVLALKYADVPVVVAPAGLALGGACEVCLHADRVVAAAEAYIGLPEVGVGLIPAAGGTKEMLLRAMLACGEKEDPLPHVQRVFETIGFGRVSTSAVDARRHGYLRQVDSIVMNRDRLISSARNVAVARAAEYVRPRPAAIRVGGEGLGAALKLGVFLAWRGGRLSDHDALIGRKLAWVLSGGSLGHLGTLTEQQLLDLEREAFLSLCGEPRTLERIAHTLKTGKPLRN